MKRASAVVLAAALLAACVGAPDPGLDYQLTGDEQKLSCDKIAGRMQVRILQIRGYQGGQGSSLLSRTMLSTGTAIFGGTTTGIDPDREVARDRAQLEAYNRQLAAKGCKTFDLDAELKPLPVTHTPEPKAKPKS